MRRISAVLLGLIWLSHGGAAGAQSAGTDLGWSPPQVQFGPAREREPVRDEPAYSGPWKLERSWYGWQTLSVDALTVAVAILANSEYVFLGGYWGAAPLLHLGHGQPGRAIGSLGVRVGMPLIGLGLGKGHGGDGESGDPGFFLGAMIGAGVGIIVDAAWLSWEEKRVPAKAAQGPTSAPLLAVSDGAALGGWQGSF